MTASERKNVKKIYFDCGAGVSGDMFLSSLIDLCEDGEHLREEMKKLSLPRYEMKIFKDRRGGMAGVRFVVEGEHEHAYRHLSDIEEIIAKSGLSDKVRTKALRAFEILAEAEGKVHGCSACEIHFHEVGAVDSIVDIVGAMVMMEDLGWPDVYFSPINVGGGTVQCAHGEMPVPAPAAAELLRGVEIYSRGDLMERVTPTGAALVKVFGGKILRAQPDGTLLATGTGLGARDGKPANILRAFLFEDSADGSGSAEICTELCANIDDMTPEDLSFAMEKIFSAGALDVWFESVQMKKNRPAFKLCVLSAEEDTDAVAREILMSTTTLGVRISTVRRAVLSRKMEIIETSFGKVGVKYALDGGTIVRRTFEFDDIAEISREYGIAPFEVRARLEREIPFDPED